MLASVKNAKTIVDKGTILFYEIINLHPFIDGNKRTAFLSMSMLLRLNGKVIKLEVTQEYIEKLAHEVAIGKLSKQKVKESINRMIK